MAELVVSNPDDKLANLFADYAQRTDKGLVLRLPHDLPTVVTLRRLGIATPAPILTQYTYPKRWDGKDVFHVQRVTTEMLTMEPRCYVLNTMGTGKTACPIYALDFLKRVGQAKRAIIFAPLSTLYATWMREITVTNTGLKGVVAHHRDRKKRLMTLREDADFYITNHAGIEVMFERLMELASQGWIDTMVIDELAVFRNAGKRTKLIKKLADKMKWVWGMTGAPAPNAPTDVFQQAKIITPHRVPKYFGTFRDDLMVKVSEFKWVPKINAVEKAYEALQPSVRFTLEDVTELPPYISRMMDVPMGVKQKHVYETLRKSCLMLFGQEQVSAVNAGVLLNKLLQVSLGYVYTSSGKTVTLDNDARLKAVLDILDSGPGAALLFIPYKHALQGFYEAIKAAGWNVAPPVSGDTSLAERSDIFAGFQQGAYKVLPAHPACLAHGITLTEADTAIWAGPIASLEQYDQANARIRRVGQTKKQQFLHLQSTPAEKKLYRLLCDRQNIQDALLQLFEDVEIPT